MAVEIEVGSNLHDDTPDSTVGASPWEFERAIEPGEVQVTTFLWGDRQKTGDDNPDSPSDDRDYDDDHGDFDGHDDDPFPDDDYDESAADDSDEDV